MTEHEDINDIEIEKHLVRWNNVLISLNLYLGTPQKPYSFLFDTGSSWLFINSRLCDNCDRWNAEWLDER